MINRGFRAVFQSYVLFKKEHSGAEGNRTPVRKSIP